MLKERKPFQYETIARTLEESLGAGRFSPGSRLPSEPELARHFGVNRRTIRRALQVLEQAAKVVRRRGHGTSVADAAGRCREILYVGDMTDHFYKERFTALQARAQERGHRLFGVTPGANGGRTWTDSLGPHLERASALIVQADYNARLGPLMKESDLRKPLIVVGNSRPAGKARCPAYYTLTDVGQAMTIGMQHLLSLGHRRIALLAMKEYVPAIASEAPPRDNQRLMSWAVDHYTAYRGALFSYGVRQWELILPADTTTPLHRNETFRKLKQVLASEDRPTAFLCDMDYRARFLYRAAAELGLVIPRDISVAGIYDTPWCQAWNPELTSVNLGHEEMAEVVMRFCEDGPAGRDIVCRIEPHLVVRHSCTAPFENRPARRKRATRAP
ncbi:MAG: substrate-binding domain-containing protein [Kiritimatiellae bacterium]|nr:substrate-binding domain-containing protein [Kiritimatiellia bacterium]